MVLVGGSARFIPQNVILHCLESRPPCPCPRPGPVGSLASLGLALRCRCRWGLLAISGGCRLVSSRLESRPGSQARWKEPSFPLHSVLAVGRFGRVLPQLHTRRLVSGAPTWWGLASLVTSRSYLAWEGGCRWSSGTKKPGRSVRFNRVRWVITRVSGAYTTCQYLSALYHRDTTTPQPTAFFTSAAIAFSSASLSSVSANPFGHMVPSSSRATSLNPSVP